MLKKNIDPKLSQRYQRRKEEIFEKLIMEKVPEQLRAHSRGDISYQTDNTVKPVICRTTNNAQLQVRPDSRYKKVHTQRKQSALLNYRLAS
ncbi:MAG: hypothetical protein ACTJLM_04830 [Ehrlichia sp.]